MGAQIDTGGIVAENRVHFGPFELNLSRGELRKGGTWIRLQEQPFQILRMVLEAPGEVVSREEIRQRLWPDQTAVEFDQSINAAVKRLRQALRDSASQPRYIKTLARRGYRFVGDLKPAYATSNEAITPSIAVLPFLDLSGGGENEYFSDGLAGEILDHLTRVPGLKVIARTSSFAFKGRKEDIRNIASTLGVAHVLEGSVQRVDSRIRVIARLISAADGSHLWSQRYDRELVDIFDIQDEIAQAISTALQVKFSGIARPHRLQLPAYDAYLKARYCVDAFSRESLALGRQLYERAIELDPMFVEARSGLDVAIANSVWSGFLPAHEGMPRARSAARSALSLDPASPEAHGVLGSISSMYDLDWNEAERCFQAAAKSEPVPCNVRWYYSVHLMIVGRLEEAVDQCERALKDDPVSFTGRFHYAATLLAAGHDVAGDTELRRLCVLAPNVSLPFYMMGVNQFSRGLYKEARASAETAHKLAPWSHKARGLFAGVLERSQERRPAEEVLAGLESGDQYGEALGLFLYFVLSSKIPDAESWAWKAIEQRDPCFFFLFGLLRSPSCGLFRSGGMWAALASRLGISVEKDR